jgi:hypothetical protein
MGLKLTQSLVIVLQEDNLNEYISKTQSSDFVYNKAALPIALFLKLLSDLPT